MPRRGGRDRIRLNRRTLAELVAQPRFAPTPAEVNAARAAEMAAKKHANGRAALACTHGVTPWTACTTCSKPRTRR